MTAPSPQFWHSCARCGEPTQDALCGNRLLLNCDESRLPTEQAPAISWRCRAHRSYQLRVATTLASNGLGDLVFSLACGHDVQWLFRGALGYTPARVAQGLASGRLQVDQPQRCYRCGDLKWERERAAREHNPYWAASQQLWRGLRTGAITPGEYQARSGALRKQWEENQYLTHQSIAGQMRQPADIVSLLTEVWAILLPREEVLTRLEAAIQRHLDRVAHRTRRRRYTGALEQRAQEMEALLSAIYSLQQVKGQQEC